MAEFDPVAAYYDRHWAPQFVSVALDPLLALMAPAVPPGARVLDLCCGTGRIAAALTGRGFTVDAIDISGAMVELATRNAPSARVWRADVLAMGPVDDYDVVLSTYNSVNHLGGTPNLRRFCVEARRVLRPGGLLVFDVNTPAAAAVNWRGTFAETSDDDVCVVRAHLDAATGAAVSDITLFSRDGDSWTRVDARLHMVCFPAEQIDDALRRAGFAEWECFDGGADLGVQALAGHVFYRAKA
ncbi:methyltransferase domain-containing protein [Streptosporangium sp. NBC_01810]|uniref:class I SAM-dependent methyltransferase n=1 Tax=Streptosporangium sp. NBC_01810 TaxID=2975951 RepID=UPI002DDC4FF7|nr:methyltransferase domain-containing protein [Streptosporangium sp. NBC_01810]WSA23444.1 methyltransferase domain-containing protein [Streptosporangium sp. NBC_01810]